MNAIRVGAAILACCTLLGACTIPGGAPFERTERIARPKPAPVGITVEPEGPTIARGTLAAVDVINPRGSVRVLVDPALTRPSVEVKPWTTAGLSRAELRAAEDAIDLVAQTVLEDGQMVLRVRADTHIEWEHLRLDLVIRTPDSRTTTVRNQHGIVELVGVGGQIAVSSGELGDGPGGDIRIRTETPVEGPVHLSTTSGDIDIFIPGESGGVLELVSDDGRVIVNVQDGVVTGAVPEDKRFTGVLNGGVNTFYARTQHGRVSLTVEDGPWARRGVFDYGRSGRDR